jgi:hypothetical protein
LHEGTTLAGQVGRDDVAAMGWREISWVQFLRAHYERAEESLTRTREFAAERDEELAWVDLIHGACRHDIGDHAAAGELLRSALERSERLPSASRSVRRSAYSAASICFAASWRTRSTSSTGRSTRPQPEG